MNPTEAMREAADGTICIDKKYPLHSIDAPSIVEIATMHMRRE
jgi:hypothetical protein